MIEVVIGFVLGFTSCLYAVKFGIKIAQKLTIGSDLLDMEEDDPQEHTGD